MQTTQPRRFHANDRFFVEVAFESPLPEGALLLAELAGPTGPGGPALTFWTTSVAIVEGSERRRVRLIGKVPADAAPGRYRVTHLEVRWTSEMPLSWEPVKVPLDHLHHDIVIEVDVPAPPSQPPIPRVLAAD